MENNHKIKITFSSEENKRAVTNGGGAARMAYSDHGIIYDLLIICTHTSLWSARGQEIFERSKAVIL